MLTVRNARPEAEAPPWLQENLTLVYAHALFATAALCIAVLGHGVDAAAAFSIAQIGGGML